MTKEQKIEQWFTEYMVEKGLSNRDSIWKRDILEWLAEKEVNKNFDLADVSGSKNYDHIRVVTIQIYAEYGKEHQRKVVHAHAFSAQELKELMEQTGNVGDYLNHLTKVLRYE